MNQTFSEHVTSTAFFLSISKRQMQMLEWAFHGHFCTGYGYPPGVDVPTGHALVRKGLMNSVWKINGTTKGVFQGPWRGKDEDQPRRGHFWELTEAGRLTCLLLAEAGLINAKRPAKVAA